MMVRLEASKNRQQRLFQVYAHHGASPSQDIYIINKCVRYRDICNEDALRKAMCDKRDLPISTPCATIFSTCCTRCTCSSISPAIGAKLSRLFLEGTGGKSKRSRFGQNAPEGSVAVRVHVPARRESEFLVNSPCSINVLCICMKKVNLYMHRNQFF